MKIFIVGNVGGTNIGESFYRAAKNMGHDVTFIDHAEATAGCFLRRKFWWFIDKKPSYFKAFNLRVMTVCNWKQPGLLLVTGISGVSGETLYRLGKMGFCRVNYLTDDPWNPAHRSRWFLKALKHYDIIFSVRRSNMHDLKSAGCPQVIYLPFGYDPGLFYPENPTEIQRRKYESDIIFVGGGDKDRLPYIHALIQAGYKIRLYGGYWDRFKETRLYASGLGNPHEIRLATACAKLALCLVRQANRDDNCMRSFEIPAIGACMLVEDTAGHRDIFGEERKSVAYFKTPNEMLQKTSVLLSQPEERARLAKAGQQLILEGQHTYKNRFATMLAYTKKPPCLELEKM